MIVVVRIVMVMELLRNLSEWLAACLEHRCPKGLRVPLKGDSYERYIVALGINVAGCDFIWDAVKPLHSEGMFAL